MSTISKNNKKACCDRKGDLDIGNFSQTVVGAGFFGQSKPWSLEDPSVPITPPGLIFNGNADGRINISSDKKISTKCKKKLQEIIERKIRAQINAGFRTWQDSSGSGIGVNRRVKPGTSLGFRAFTDGSFDFKCCDDKNIAEIKKWHSFPTIFGTSIVDGPRLTPPITCPPL
jgi:hypothetical protein